MTAPAPGWGCTTADPSLGLMGDVIWHKDCTADGDPKITAEALERIRVSQGRESVELTCPACGATSRTPAPVTFDGVAALIACLDAAGVRYWLRGGWALDFHLGRITRDHADIDLMVETSDWGRFLDALPVDADAEDTLEQGWWEAYVEEFGATICAIPFERFEDGSGFASIPSFFRFRPPATFLDETGTIGAVTAHVVSLRALLAEKLAYEDVRSVPQRPKDQASIALLEELTSAEQGSALVVH